MASQIIYLSRIAVISVCVSIPDRKGATGVNIVSRGKWFALGLAIIIIGAAAVVVYPSLQRKRDLAETLLWMDQTYNPHEGGDNFGQGHGWEIHYLQKDQIEEVTEKFRMTFARVGGCSMVITFETVPEGVYSETPSVSKYTVNLCDIDPESISMKTHDLHSKDVFDCADSEEVKLFKLNCTNAEIDFKTRDSATAIKDERVETFVKLTGKDHELKTESQTNKCWLIVDDVDYAKRLAKALKHAVELCGGKRSKF